MATSVTVGRRLIPRNHVAFVEPYIPGNSRVQSSRDFQGRVMLVNRDSVLIEESPRVFAQTHGFRMLDDDNLALNPAVQFSVETFVPAEDFKPEKAYASRLRWRDLDGNDQSKLLLSLPETVLEVVTANAAANRGPNRAANGQPTGRRKQSATSGEPASEP